jgi:hypothetical protein
VLKLQIPFLQLIRISGSRSSSVALLRLSVHDRFAAGVGDFRDFDAALGRESLSRMNMRRLCDS